VTQGASTESGNPEAFRWPEPMPAKPRRRTEALMIYPVLGLSAITRLAFVNGKNRLLTGKPA
jgi:hypothetical protein